MGSMLKFDSERRELVRERRDARIERKQQRRQARAHKRSHMAETLFTPSAEQQLAERDVQAAVDRIVEEALERHEQTAPPATRPTDISPAPRAVQAPPRQARSLGVAGVGEPAPSGREGTVTSSRSASAGSRRSPKHAPTPADGSPGPESWHRSPTRSRRSSIRRPDRGARSASSWRRRSRPGGSSRSAPPPAGPCGRSAATRRAPPAGPGATRISRWRSAWRTRSLRGCRAPRSEAPSAPARSRKRDRIAGARSGAEGAAGRNRRRGPRAGRCALRASTAGRSTNPGEEAP